MNSDVKLIREMQRQAQERSDDDRRRRIAMMGSALRQPPIPPFGEPVPLRKSSPDSLDRDIFRMGIILACFTGLVVLLMWVAA